MHRLQDGSREQVPSLKKPDGRNKQTKKKQKPKLNCLLAVLFHMSL